MFQDGLAFPSVKVEIEFLSPVHYGDRVTVSVRVLKVGSSSIQLQYEASVDGRPVFKARQVTVAVEMESFKSTPLPDWLRERFLAAVESP